MPQLRKGQIVHYVHGLDDPYPGAVEPAIIVRVSGDESVGYEAAISVFGSHGQLYRDGVRVADGPDAAGRGQAFWPDDDAPADIDFLPQTVVAASGPFIGEPAGEVPVEAAGKPEDPNNPNNPNDP